MASWLTNQLRAAEGLLEAVDRTAKVVSETTALDGDLAAPRPAQPKRTKSQGNMKKAQSADLQRPAAAAPAAALPAEAAQPDKAPNLSPADSLAPAAAKPEPPAATPSKAPSAPESEQEMPAAAQNGLQAPPAAAAELDIGVLPQSTPAAAAAVVAPTDASASGPLATETAAQAPPSGETDNSPAAVAPRAAAGTQGPAAGAGDPGSFQAATLAMPSAEPDQQLQQQQQQRVSTARSTSSQSSAAEAERPAGSASSSLPLASGSSPDDPAAADGAAPYQPASKAAARQVLDLELAEARTLAESAGAGGSTAREQRLQRVVDKLRARLEQYKDENAQLEEMLHQADARYHGGAGQLEELEEALAKAEVARISAEAALAQAKSAREAEVGRLEEQLAAARDQMAQLDLEVQGLQASKDAMMEKHQEDETTLLQSLRQEVAAMEARLAAEQAAHAASRRDAEGRQDQLESTLAESAADLASMQRQLEERAAQLAAARDQAAQLMAELDAARAAGGGTAGALGGGSAGSLSVEASVEVSNLKAQCEFLRGELALAQQAAEAAEADLTTLAEEAQALRRQVDEASSATELQSRLKELTDLLYVKQNQLERLAGEKAAQALAFERQLRTAKDEADKLRRRGNGGGDGGAGPRGQGGINRNGSSGGSEYVVPMDSLPAYYKLAENKRVGRAVQVGARYIDMGTSTVVRVLREYPLARLAVFMYALFIHLYCYFLLHRLQGHAMSLEHDHVRSALEAAHTAAHQA